MKRELIYTPREAAVALNIKLPAFYRRFYLAFPGEQIRSISESELVKMALKPDGRGRRASGLSKQKQDFLDCFNELEEIQKAAEAAGITRQAIYASLKRRQDNPRYDPVFARAFYDVKLKVRDRQLHRKLKQEHAGEQVSCECGLTMRAGRRAKHRGSPTHRCAKALQRLVNDGLTLSAIGERFSLSAMSVGTIARKLGIDTSRGQRRRGPARKGNTGEEK